MMSNPKMKWTAGPWSIEFFQSPNPGLEDWPSININNSTGYNIAEIHLPDDEDEANAQLIASAPELYEALREAVELMPLGTTVRANWLTKTSELLAKARGEKA
jgi:hypothetical protein